VTHCLFLILTHFLSFAYIEPTPENLTCVSFQYAIENDNGFNASDLFNEVNNTYKTGLIIATRNITIEILNETFPRDGSMRFLRGKSDWRHHIEPTNEELKFEGLGSLHVASLQGPNLQSFSKPGIPLLSDGNRRRTVYLPQKESDGEIIDVSQLSRQLVFYTDEFPVTIDGIFDNPFCGATPPILCAIVASTVCTLLEDGDDEDQVQKVLLEGLEESVDNGDLNAAIPPENQLPPV
jgi:hypothetical protein